MTNFSGCHPVLYTSDPPWETFNELKSSVGNLISSDVTNVICHPTPKRQQEKEKVVSGLLVAKDTY